eukprot:gene376-440_t
MSGQKFLHPMWVDRTGIPVASRFVEGHHCTECYDNDEEYGIWRGDKRAHTHRPTGREVVYVEDSRYNDGTGSHSRKQKNKHYVEKSKEAIVPPRTRGIYDTEKSDGFRNYHMHHDFYEDGFVGIKNKDGYDTRPAPIIQKKNHKVVRHHTLEDFHGNERPRFYSNDLYQNPRVIDKGHHCRKYLLRSKGEFFTPVVYQKPYFIERVNTRGDIHKYYLSDENQINAKTMAHKFEKEDLKYRYDEDPMYVRVAKDDESSLLRHMEQDRDRAHAKAREKEVMKSQLAKDPVYIEQRAESPVLMRKERSPILTRRPSPVVERRPSPILTRPSPVYATDQVFVQEPQYYESRQYYGTQSEPVMEQRVYKEHAYSQPIYQASQGHLVEEIPLQQGGSSGTMWVSKSDGSVMESNYDGGRVEKSEIIPTVIRENVQFQKVPTTVTQYMDAKGNYYTPVSAQAPLILPKPALYLFGLMTSQLPNRRKNGTQCTGLIEPYCPVADFLQLLGRTVVKVDLKEKIILVTTPIAITGAIASYFIYDLKNKLQLAKERVEKERQAKLHEQKKCEEQRLGRTRAERELRRHVNSLKEDRDNKNADRPPDYPPIGFLECCFRERNGTPRQGCFVTKGRAVLRLSTKINPVHALEGLDQYSHCWLIFVFHENTNTLRAVRTDRPGSMVKAKVRPPKLDGVKVGLFSTRTPHRPNAIGLSIAKIDKIEGNALHLSGIDLIDGTPILDVKPYIKHYDAVFDAVNPAWTLTPTVQPLKAVHISAEADAQLVALVNRRILKFYDNVDDIRTAIMQVLIEDIRSTRKRKSDKIHEAAAKNGGNDEEDESTVVEEGPEKHRFCIDTLNVRFTVEDEIAHVFEIQHDIVLKEEDKNIYMPSSIYKGGDSTTTTTTVTEPTIIDEAAQNDQLEEDQ